MKMNSALVLVGGVILGGWYLKKKVGDGIEAVGDALNPTKDTNLAYRGASYLDSKVEFNHGWDDKIFGAIDLINPWNEYDGYARQVWGLGDDS